MLVAFMTKTLEKLFCAVIKVCDYCAEEYHHYVSFYIGIRPGVVH